MSEYSCTSLKRWTERFLEEINYRVAPKYQFEHPDKSNLMDFIWIFWTMKTLMQGFDWLAFHLGTHVQMQSFRLMLDSLMEIKPAVDGKFEFKYRDKSFLILLFGSIGQFRVWCKDHKQSLLNRKISQKGQIFNETLMEELGFQYWH